MARKAISCICGVVDIYRNTFLITNGYKMSSPGLPTAPHSFELCAGTKIMAETVRRAFAAAVCAAAAMSIAARAQAAGTAFAVEAAEVSAVGSCKVETWLSAASNHDFIGVVTTACVVALSRPVELSAQINRARGDGEWATAVSPKVKTNVVPTAIGSWGWAFAASATYDTASGENRSEEHTPALQSPQN